MPRLLGLRFVSKFFPENESVKGFKKFTETILDNEIPPEVYTLNPRISVGVTNSV
jgi:hypothetical protein